MRKIIAAILFIGTLYYFRHQIWDLPMFQPLRDNVLVGNSLEKLSKDISKKLTEQTVTDELKTWVLKNGVKLPQDWTLEEKTFGAQKVTIMVPPNPQSADDYIALGVKKETISKLPVQHICKDVTATTTCLVGGNYETMRTFSIMTFVK